MKASKKQKPPQAPAAASASTKKLKQAERRSSSRQPRPRASSLKHAAALLGVNADVLRAAKERGAPGFDSHNRVDLDALRAWLRDNAPASMPKAPAEQFRALLMTHFALSHDLHRLAEELFSTRAALWELLEEYTENDRFAELEFPNSPNAGKRLVEALDTITPLKQSAARVLNEFVELDRAWRISGYDWT